MLRAGKKKSTQALESKHEDKEQELTWTASFRKATRGNNSKDWMLFTAADHLNALPCEMTDTLKLAHLNFTVGKLATAKGAHQDSILYFQAALSCLEALSGDKWQIQYSFTLNLLSEITEAARATGDFDYSIKYAEEIFDRAKTLPEKFRAQVAYMGVHYEATNPSIVNVLMEIVKLQIALRGRPISCFVEFPTAVDKKLIAQSSIVKAMATNAHLAKNEYMFAIIVHRMITICLRERAVTVELPLFICCIQFISLKAELWSKSFRYTAVVRQLLDRFLPECRNRAC